MPGLTNNDKHIDAANESIVALNDIASRKCCPPKVIFFGLEGELEPTDGTEFSDPPPGWEPTTEMSGSEEYFARKCGVSNQIVNALENVTFKLDSANIADIATISLDLVFSTFVTILTDAASGPFLVATSVGGAVWSLVKTIVEQNIDLTTLTTISQNNRSDLVCALYSAGDAATAVNDIVTEYGNNGASAADQQFIRDILELTGAANNLFYERFDTLTSEAAPFTTDCDTCASCLSALMGAGSRVQDTFTSQFFSSTNDYRVHFWVNVLPGNPVTTCAPASNLTFSNWSGFTARTVQARNGIAISDDTDIIASVGSSFEVVNTNTQPPSPTTYNTCRAVLLTSSTPFTVDITGFS